MSFSNAYDVLIVGAGIAGCSLAHGLSTIPRSKPLRICLLERSLSEPDRIVGELLQPGGVIALRKLGIEKCLEGIDAIPVKGYCVVEDGKSVEIPYPGRHEGRSFHHGRFIMALRAAAKEAKGVDVVEATVTELVEQNGRVVGVKATNSGEKEEYRADLVVVADGCFSNFRTAVMGPSIGKSITRSHFVGAILEDASLPIPNHGTVALVKGFGPVLLYQIGEHDTRILIDVKAPLPPDIKSHILVNIVPQLPPILQQPIRIALDKDRLRRMPNSFLPAVSQGTTTKPGVFLLGDSWNMRHPLTGGGMTVALNDVVILRSLLANVDLRQWSEVQKVLQTWHWSRKPLASTVNILSVALYDLFGADDEELKVLRTGCFKYFERGGECVNGPVSLLSGIAPSPLLLATHFFAVAFYSIWVMFTHPVQVGTIKGQPVYARPLLHHYPALFFKGIRVFWTACVVFGPLLWSEIRWWGTGDSIKSSLTIAGLPVLLGLVAIGWMMYGAVEALG